MADKRSRRLGFHTGVLIIQMSALLFVLFAASSYNQVVVPSRPATVDEHSDSGPAPDEITYGEPLRLSIPSLELDRELLDGEYDPTAQSWTLSSRGIHFATASAPPNDFAGSTFIYGHNNKYVFGELDTLRVGDKAEILTRNNIVFTYTLSSREEVNPDDTSPLMYRGSPRLTIQTCSGSWFENREMFYFELTSVDHINTEDTAVAKALSSSRYTPGSTSAVSILTKGTL